MGRLILQQFSTKAEQSQSIDMTDLVDQEIKQGDLLNYISRICIRIWHIRITLVLNKTFILYIIALFDIGVNLNFIRGGLIPTK